jgi:hypothetical protein
MFDRSFAINVKGPYFLIQALLTVLPSACRHYGCWPGPGGDRRLGAQTAVPVAHAVGPAFTVALLDCRSQVGSARCRSTRSPAPASLSARAQGVARWTGWQRCCAAWTGPSSDGSRMAGWCSIWRAWPMRRVPVRAVRLGRLPKTRWHPVYGRNMQRPGAQPRDPVKDEAFEIIQFKYMGSRPQAPAGPGQRPGLTFPPAR